MRGKNKPQSLSPLVSFSLSLQYNVTKTHKTCRKIIVLLFVCAGGIVVYSLCTIVSVQSVWSATIGSVLSVGVLCIRDLWWSVCMCECRDGTGGAAGAPSSPSVRPIVIIISVPIVSASNDESSGEMTVSWELLVMILVGVCKTITELLVWLVGWLVVEVTSYFSNVRLSLHLWRQRIWRLSS